jgi:lipopolysaccharide transport system permease protein
MTQELIIEPGRADSNYWRDLWRYRELFQVLAWRDISVRYKQTVIGAAWALIRPVLTMIVFTVIFGKIAKLPSEGTAPYALMVFAGLLPWTFFSTSLTDASNSLISSSNLIGKVYFPRLIVPAATVGVALIDFLVSFAIYLVLVHARLAGCVSPRIRPPCNCDQHWSRRVDYGVERQISRFSLHHPVHRAIRPLCFPSRL